MTTPTPHGAPELLPCPFCGGKAAVVPRAVNIALQKDPSDPKFGVSIICAQCSSETANMVDEAHAAAKWNRRASSPAIEPPKQQPVHLAGGECGGVPQWLPIEIAPMYTLVRLYAQGGGFHDEDFNPSGSVEGFLSDDGGWCGAFWNAEQDCWDRRDGIVPTHWMPLPPAPTGQINPDSVDSVTQGKEGES